LILCLAHHWTVGTRQQYVVQRIIPVEANIPSLEPQQLFREPLPEMGSHIRAVVFDQQLEVARRDPRPGLT
jgi:hypothetical protein